MKSRIRAAASVAIRALIALGVVVVAALVLLDRVLQEQDYGTED